MRVLGHAFTFINSVLFKVSSCSLDLDFLGVLVCFPGRGLGSQKDAEGSEASAKVTEEQEAQLSPPHSPCSVMQPSGDYLN